MYPVKINATALVSKEIREGRLIRPDECSECESTKAIHGHHDDYAYPLVVRWLCAKCHKRWHMANGPGLNGGKEIDKQADRLKKSTSSREDSKGGINIKRSIAVCCAKKGIKTSELARRIDALPGFISQIKRQNDCSTKTIRRLAKAFDIDPIDFLVEGVEE